MPLVDKSAAERQAVRGRARPCSGRRRGRRGGEPTWGKKNETCPFHGIRKSTTEKRKRRQLFPHRPVLWDRARSQSPRATQCHPVSANRHPAGWHGRPRSRSCAHLRCRRGTPWALGPRTCYVCSSSPRRSRARSSPADARSPWPRRRRPTVSVLTRASALAAMRPNHHFDALLHCNTPAAPPRAHSHALAHAAE